MSEGYEQGAENGDSLRTGKIFFNERDQCVDGAADLCSQLNPWNTSITSSTQRPPPLLRQLCQSHDKSCDLHNRSLMEIRVNILAGTWQQKVSGSEERGPTASS